MGLSPAAVLYDASGNPITVVSDGGDYRLAGVNKVVNASGSQINPATQETLALIKDTDGIKKIVDALPAGSNEIGRVRSFLYDDVNQVALAVAREATIPANTRGILILGEAQDGKSYAVRVSGLGKVAVESSLPGPPPGTTEFVLSADDPLSVGPSPNYHETVSTAITNGEHLHIQFVAGGAEGDPSERGSMVEVYWREGGTPTDHLIERIFLTGETVYLSLPDTGKARDGTTLAGDGSTTKLVIRRERLSTSAQRVDAVVRGYTETV